MYEIDKQKPKTRRQTQKRPEMSLPTDAQNLEVRNDSEISVEQAEARQLVAEMAQSFIGTIKFYNSEWVGKTYSESVESNKEFAEWRRGAVENPAVEEIQWRHLAAVAEKNIEDGYKLWLRIRESAADELASGSLTGKVVGNTSEPYERAQYLAIRDSFADEWQPRGGIESAMIDMLTVAFSLQMYWTTIAHKRVLQLHDAQKKDLNRYESKGWKSPYQYEADAIEQAHRLADGYNRQFLRVLRQLRDLRRYSPVVIQNNGGQVNVGAQQVNVNKS